ncbi:MAG: tripartite tricarboxylate transporter substrate binding protein [Lysobacteraceae bacterium]
MKKSILISMTMVLATAWPTAMAADAGDVAADFPNKPIRIIVPYPPGGSTDALARMLGQKLSTRFEQPVVVENRAGASGNLGANLAAKSPPDGYTLFLGTSTALAVNPHLYPSLPYNPQQDFAPLILATSLPSLVVVNSAVPVSTIRELNEYLKSRPESVNYASSGNGTPAHLGVEMYKNMTGLSITHVPYKGGAPALVDLVGGQTSLMFAILPESWPLVKDGRLKALAITTAERSPLMPDVPTVAEAGVPGYELVGWYGLLAPAGTPKEIVNKLNQALDQALHEKDVLDKLTAAGFQVEGGKPERLGQLMRSESTKWGQVVKDANIKVD